MLEAPEVQTALKSTAELIQNSYERNVTKEYPKGQLIHDGRSTDESKDSIAQEEVKI